MILLRSVIVLFLIKCIVSQDMEIYRSLTSFRDCFGRKHAIICFKEKALDALNETIMTDKPISFYGLIDIERNPNFHLNATSEELPQEFSARSSRLSDILHNKVEEFFKSRVVKFNLAPAFDEDIEEGRKKGGGGGGGKGKGGMMMMMAMGGMACMVAQMMMGKIAFLAGTALILAKVALFLSAIVGLKKLAGSGGGGSETQHVVYASSGDYGHSHGGGGGWHRSLDNDALNIAYRAHSMEDTAGY